MRDVQNWEVPKCGAVNLDCLSVSESPGKFLEWMYTEVWGIQTHLFISTYLAMTESIDWVWLNVCSPQLKLQTYKSRYEVNIIFRI